MSYEMIRFEDSTPYRGLPEFEYNSVFVNSEKVLTMYGCAVYFVKSEWKHNADCLLAYERGYNYAIEELYENMYV